jgi:hypothetical protein
MAVELLQAIVNGIPRARKIPRNTKREIPRPFIPGAPNETRRIPLNPRFDPPLGV